MDKQTFTGKMASIQPRIYLIRSFDEVSHAYKGYTIQLQGEISGDHTVFTVGIGEATQSKHQLKVNNVISGECLPVLYPELEPVEYYKVSKLKVIQQGEPGSAASPWEQEPPELEVYRKRGHRRLAARTYTTQCSSCMWGARMPVEIIVDNWSPSAPRKYRFETFCYGPLSCRRYKAGPNRQVPGRGGAVYVEEDWVDEAAVEHRSEDE